MIHNAFVQQVKTIAITGDQLWSFIQKNYTGKVSWKGGGNIV
jgi:hypothetical protein